MRPMMFFGIFGGGGGGAAPAMPSVEELTPKIHLADIDEFKDFGFGYSNELADASRGLQNRLDPFIDPTRQTLQKNIYDNLKLGGRLTPEQQSEVVRAGLGNVGGTGMLGSTAGAGLVARDLGLRSYELAKDRRAEAADLLSANPEPMAGFGLDALGNLMTSNLNLQNQQEQQRTSALGSLASAQAQQANAAQAAEGQQQGATIGVIGSLAGAAIVAL